MILKKIITILTVWATVGAISSAQSFRGEMLEFEINDSQTYPGTVRKVNVYVPTQYKADKPACLLVRMDGIGHDIPKIMDELIDEGAMPVTIAVFINPGRILDENGSVLRYNRSNEYDRMTDTWALFIENEVLPRAESLCTSDGRKVIISRRAADRAINGDSSGGIASFTAAWLHPELYSRVYSMVGTFVPFRGGDGYPALIRKMEPKPLRIFLQDNDEDSWNLTFGSWYEANLMMLSALEYAGYDVRHQWDKGGHNGKNGGKIMKEVLRWLWSGWPEAVMARKGGNELINSLLVDGEGWVEVQEMKGVPSHEARYPGGAFIARPKLHTNAIVTYITGKDDSLKYGEDFYWLHQEGGTDDGDRYLAFDTEGWLYATSSLGIQICDQNGRVRGIISVPAGKLEEFSFVDNMLYVKVNGCVYSRKVNHYASTAQSPAPKSQNQG